MLNQNAKDILKAGIGLANALSDGFDWSDIGALVSFPSAIDGWNDGVDNLRASWESGEGRDEIIQFVKNEFDIDNDGLEEWIEDVIGWIGQTYKLYKNRPGK